MISMCFGRIIRTKESRCFSFSNNGKENKQWSTPSVDTVNEQENRRWDQSTVIKSTMRCLRIQMWSMRCRLCGLYTPTSFSAHWETQVLCLMENTCATLTIRGIKIFRNTHIEVTWYHCPRESKWLLYDHLVINNKHKIASFESNCFKYSSSISAN